MSNFKREDIQIISRNSNWSVADIEKTLEKNIYSSVQSWKLFLRLFLISLGISFSTAGIIFFFAYNWYEMNPFLKLGIMEGLVILPVLAISFLRFNNIIKKIILSAASVLVGGLFLVFGQVYQTGANAYDFFLVWTLFITLWALAANFPPLWLIFLTLLNITIHLYGLQVGNQWSQVDVSTSLFIVNCLALIAFRWLPLKSPLNSPAWFTNIVALAAIFFATIGIMNIIFDDNESSLLLIILTLISYAGGIFYGYRSHSGFYLATISFSMIFIISSIIIKTSEGEDDAGLFLMLGLFIIGSVTAMIRVLIYLQKKWTDGK